MTEKKDTSLVAAAASNASAAASAAATAAASAASNAQIAAKAAAESATAIAIVATDTTWMKKSLSGIEQTLDEMGKSFVTASQHLEIIKFIDNHENRLNSLETEKTKVTVMLGIGVSIVTLLVSLLIYHLFQQ